MGVALPGVAWANRTHTNIIPDLPFPPNPNNTDPLSSQKNYLGDNLLFLYFIMFDSVLTGMVCYNSIPPSAIPHFFT